MTQLRANPLNEPIGLQLYTVGSDLAQDIPGTLKKIAAIGYTQVELAPTYGKSAAEWKALFNDHGLTCRSAHMFDPAQSPEQFLEFANELGVKYVVTSFNPPPGLLAQMSQPHPDFSAIVAAFQKMGLDDYKRSADTANQIGREAHQRGLVYAYHNHNVEFTKFGNETGFDVIVNGTDPELVKLELDCGWVSAAGHDPAEIIRAHPDRVRMLHIKAFQAGPPTVFLDGPQKPIPTELGRGKPDYQHVFAAAAEAKVEQYYVEQEPPFHDMPPLEAIRADYEYLHHLSA